MSLWTNLSGGVRAIWRKRETESEMDEELRAYLQAAVERNVRRGMSLRDAMREARIEMGSLESVKDGIRSAGWESALEALWGDIRYSGRVLAKAPVFTAVVVLTLALGIGANTAIFSLIDAILMRSLPVQHPEQLVEVSHASFTNPLWEQVRDQQNLFSGVFAWSWDRFNLSRGGIWHFADGIWVSGDFFRTLGIRPAAGRLLSTGDDRRGCPARAVISYGFWQSHYGGAPTAVGSNLSLNGKLFEVIGVVPAGFYGMDVGTKFDVGIPLCSADLFDSPRSRLDQRSWWWLRAAGRMKPGMAMPQLKTGLAALSPRIYGAAVPQNWDSKSQENFRKRVLVPEPMSTGLSGLRKDYSEPLHVLMAVVGLVLLIACANIASLLMARAAGRGKEMAMRQALGASRYRLMRQLIMECAWLSFAGAALGLVFARWGNTVLVRYLSTLRSTVFLDFAPDSRVLIFTAGVAICTALLFGIAPALRGTRVSLGDAMKEPKSGSRGIRRQFRMWIVASQVALSLVLLVTAGLLLRTFWNLANLDVGFDRNQVLVANVGLGTTGMPRTGYKAVYDQVESTLRAQPGVIAAARSMRTPLSNFEWNTYVQSDVPNRPTGEDSLAWFNFVSPAYFEVLRTPLLAGRNLSTADVSKSTPVAVINQTMARRFFPGVNPIGRTFQVEGEARKLEPPVQVVGIVKDAKYESMREETYATVFGPVTQYPAPDYENFEIRTAVPLPAMTEIIQKAIAGVNKDIPIEIHTLSAQVNDSMARERLLASLAVFFGGLALLLAVIGLYGTLSYMVTQRRIEFGIRTALGARPRTLLRLVLRDVLAVLSLGLAAGLGLSLATTRVLGTLLFGLQPRDVATLALSAGLLGAVSLGAAGLAARRAAKVDPMVALRHL